MDKCKPHCNEEERQNLIDTKDARDYFLENGKPEINELVWRLASCNTTLREAEKIACEIYTLIDNTYDERKA